MTLFARLFGFARSDRSDSLAPGRAALRARRFDEAWAALSVALDGETSARGRALAHNARALVALGRGERELARAELERALALDPRCVNAIVNLGNLALEAGDVQSAVERFEAALRIDPDFADAHHNLGVAYKRLGRQRDAVRALRRATSVAVRRR